MRINYSISLKLTMIAILVTAVISVSIAYVNIHHLEETILESHYDKAPSIIQALNASIGSSDNLNDQEHRQKSIDNLISENTQVDDETKEITKKVVLSATINLLDEKDNLIIAASTDKTSIGSPAKSYIVEGLDYAILTYEENNTYLIPDIIDENHILISLSPICRDGKIRGTYEIILSMDDAYASINDAIMSILLYSTAILLILIFVFLYLMRKAVVTPINKFRDTAKVIGQGNLDAEVNIKSRDELGELANAFNQMAKDLKESRTKIEEYNKILENLLDRKDEFIGQLGHDLKNPLQPFIGLLPMLIEEEKDPEIKEALVIMNHSAEYMRDLIFKTLQLAKLRSASIKFDMEDLNLKEEANQVIESQKLLFKENKITVENKIDNKIMVNADKLRLSELFKNLITNSVKYTSDDGGKIIINAKEEDEKVTVSIKDTGIGMTKEQLSRIFDEYYKADKFSSEYTSTGLGLAICKRIVEKHDGEIWVESPGSGKGSTFYFTLKSKAKNN